MEVVVGGRPESRPAGLLAQTGGGVGVHIQALHFTGIRVVHGIKRTHGAAASELPIHQRQPSKRRVARRSHRASLSVHHQILKAQVHVQALCVFTKYFARAVPSRGTSGVMNWINGACTEEVCIEWQSLASFATGSGSAQHCRAHVMLGCKRPSRARLGLVSNFLKTAPGGELLIKINPTLHCALISSATKTVQPSAARPKTREAK